jgi:hypothetical protein
MELEALRLMRLSRRHEVHHFDEFRHKVFVLVRVGVIGVSSFPFSPSLDLQRGRR